METLRAKSEIRAGSLRVLGIMSGTSMDGVDFVLCEIDPKRIRLRQHWKVEYPRPLRSRLRAAATGEANSHALAQMHHDLGRFYAKHASCPVSSERVDLVGLHGQTVFHEPGKVPASFQLGEPSYLVETLRAPVVSNFRSADIAAGGQGAPLATLFHRTAFAEAGSHICVNNLGGISNVTSLDWRKSRNLKIAAFDTGPGNMLIDLAVQQLTSGARRFDRDGSWARKGEISERLVSEWLKHPYFSKRPPKSTGREMFGEPFLQRAIAKAAKLGLTKFSVIASLTELTAASIVLNYRLHLKSLPDRIILTGGGVENKSLLARIRKRLECLPVPVELCSSSQFGWPHQTVEGAAFALLAYYRVQKRRANIPSTTGARRTVLLGQISEF